jgi:hypothetical protein
VIRDQWPKRSEYAATRRERFTGGTGEGSVALSNTVYSTTPISFIFRESVAQTTWYTTQAYATKGKGLVAVDNIVRSTKPISFKGEDSGAEVTLYTTASR